MRIGKAKLQSVSQHMQKQPILWWRNCHCPLFFDGTFFFFFDAFGPVICLFLYKIAFPLWIRRPPSNNHNQFLQKSTHLLSLQLDFGTLKDKTDGWLYSKIWGRDFAAVASDVGKNPSDFLSAILRAKEKWNKQTKTIKKNPPAFFLEQCGWVLRTSSVFVLKQLVRRHLTLKFSFPVYQLERADRPPSFSLPCQHPSLTK